MMLHLFCSERGVGNQADTKNFLFDRRDGWDRVWGGGLISSHKRGFAKERYVTLVFSICG